jgi:hypothetical protein
MPKKNAFDFVERPEHRAPDDGESAAQKAKSTKTQFKKIMEGLKRKSRQTYVNKRMSLVKMD